MPDRAITAIGAVLDCADPEQLADFWQAAIGFEVRTGDANPYITLSGSSIRRPLNHLTLQKVPEGKTGKLRLHLDLFTKDLQGELARLLELGASVITRHPDGASDEDLVMVVLADPEGNELCVIPSPSSST